MAKNRNGKHLQKKNNLQRAAYNSFVADTSYSYDDTTSVNMESLRGTNEPTPEPSINKSEEPVGKPLKFVIFDWIKKNSFAAIIVPLFIALIVWICSSIIGLKIDEARLEERVSTLKENVKDINTDSASKIKLSNEIDSVKKDIGVFKGNNDLIEKRINYIENEIDKMRKNP